VETNEPLVSAETQGLLLGYLDSNQEQKIVVSAVLPTRNWGGIPRISAVLMYTVYALARNSTGRFRSRCGAFGPFLVTFQRLGINVARIESCRFVRDKKPWWIAVLSGADAT
jgi:hypothetical protein